MAPVHSSVMLSFALLRENRSWLIPVALMYYGMDVDGVAR